MSIAQYIDHTLLKPDATEMQIRQLCKEALEYKFASVCVNPCWVKLAAALLRGSEVKTCVVIGFPLGANCTSTKVYEAIQALGDGARELDMVLNIGALKSGDLKLVEYDIHAVRQSVPEAVLKVILETCLLTEDEKVTACMIAKKAGADFVKTSTGFSSGGATADDILLMRHLVGPDMGVKASGGIKTYVQAQRMVDVGASRLGCSASVAIVQEEQK